MASAGGGRTVLVVGGGPAGLAAVAELEGRGLDVTVVDEAFDLGGRYFKRFNAAPGVSRGTELDALREEGLQRTGALDPEQVAARTDTLAWGVFPGNQVGLYHDGHAEVVQPAAIVLATGAIERVAAFPGWTLPGVVTVGGVQTLLSREAILPGKYFLVAGTGPLLLATAVEIAEAGGEVVAVIEGSAATAPLRHVHHFLGQARRLRQAIDYGRALHQRGIPLHTGQMVVSARGDGELTEVTVSRVDREWRVVPGSEMRYDVDTLCVHYGFAASTELARMAGCDVAWDPERGGWYVVHDDAMRAGPPGLYVAGQLAGIGGADLATATGRLAGLTVARDLGVLDEAAYAHAAADARSAVRDGLEFARVLNSVYAPGIGLADAITPETVVCACEEVAAAEVDAAIGAGSLTLNDVKRRTRAGMGLCQGRICSPILRSYLERRAGVGAEQAGLITARPPVKPIPLAALAAVSGAGVARE